MNDNLENIIKDIKLKEFYDPNALHDLSKIIELSTFIDVLSINRISYLSTFVNSKILNKEELIAIVPEDKMAQMLINGFKYNRAFKDNPELLKNPLEIINTDEYNFSIGGRWNDVNPYEGYIESFVIVDDSIICLPFNKECGCSGFLKSRDATVLRYAFTYDDGWYTYNYIIDFDASNNEVCFINIDEKGNKSYAHGIGTIIHYIKS